MTGFTKIVFATVFFGGCVSLLGAIVWSWVRWARSRHPRTATSICSLIGLTLATTAALLAFSPVVSKPFVFGVVQGLTPQVSLAGLLFAIGGALRPNPLRWHALGSAAAMFAFSLLVLVSG